VLQRLLDLLDTNPPHAVFTASSSAFRAIRASPPTTAASAASAFSSISTLIAPRPRSSSTSARRSTPNTCSSVSGSSLNTRDRESSAEITSNDGFSVVAPIMMIVPSST
jgi:hypothetical protein